MARGSSSRVFCGVELPRYDKFDGCRAAGVYAGCRERGEDEGICWSVLWAEEKAFRFSLGVLFLEDEADWEREPLAKTVH